MLYKRDEVIYNVELNLIRNEDEDFEGGPLYQIGNHNQH